MSLNIAIITNLNGIGLQRDFELLRDFLQELGHDITGIQYDGSSPAGQFDLAIFLEVVPRGMVNLAPVRWWFGNPEWCEPEKIKLVHRHIDKVFAKTYEAKRIFDEAFPGKTHYVGFLARNQWDIEVPRERKFLHIGGNSSFRGTQAVVDAWKWEKNGAHLESKLAVISTVVKEGPETISFAERVDEDELKRLQNSCMFHIYPSGTEGFGHAMRETLSVGALLITVDAPPMNEILGAFLIPCSGKTKAGLADVYEVSALDVYEAVDRISKEATNRDLSTKSLIARAFFNQENRAFRGAFTAHLEELQAKPEKAERARSDKPSIAFIGNFSAEHSTENQIKWALEQGLGYEVDTLQENRVTASDIYKACEYSKILIWVRTPGWLRVQDEEMFQLLSWCKNEDVKTLSIHLDKFWGIPDREFLIGKIPFWKTAYCFTADGSRQEDFKKRGVNHFWMKPAVSEVYCHPGTPRDEYLCDVGFVGAKEYHAEYPFRRQMVEFLEETYGNRFKHVEGVRGHLLNDVYASMKVVVGDCFQAGTPHYWSDRVPETCGRHGFLLHPEVEGLLLPVATYKAQNLESLKFNVEYWLSHEDERASVERDCFERTMGLDTWTYRVGGILETIR